MHKVISTFFLLAFFSGQAQAESCPAFFRFVDFGIETPDGVVHRGGPTYRAQGFAGQPLLITQRTACRQVRDVAIDGRGNPIPVVTSINYAPAATGMNINELRLMVVDDAALLAEDNAVAHRARLESLESLESIDGAITRGPNYLCASLMDPITISCQLTQPFGGNLALVVYCDPLECRMSVFAVRENIIAIASWQPSEASFGDPNTAAQEIARMVQQVHGFLAPLSS